MSSARRIGFIVAGAVLLVALLALAFRGPLANRIIVAALHRTLGVNATIASVGGSVFGDLELRGVLARGDAGTGPLAAIAAERVSARYSLAALAHGTAAFLDTLEVTVEGARIEIDLARPPAPAGTPAEQPAATPAFPRLPRLLMRDSQLIVKGQGYSLTADGLRGEIARADRAGDQAIRIDAARFTLRHPSVVERAIALSVEGRASARRLAITSVKRDGEPLVEHASLDLGERPGDLDLQLALRLWQGRAELGLQKRQTQTDARWEVRGVDLQPQQVFVNPALGALRGQLTSSGAVAVGSGGLPRLTGTLTLDWKGAQLAGRAVDHLTIRGSAEPGVVLVERAEGLIGPNEVLLRQVRLPAEALFDGRWRALLGTTAGSFNAALGDLPAFLALWGVEVEKGAARVPAHRLRFEGTLDQGVVRIARADLAAGLGTAVLTGVTVTLPREDREWGETTFDGRADVDIPNLGDLSALFPLPPLRGSLRGQVTGAGTFTKPQGSVVLAGRELSVSGRLLGDVELRARATGERVEVETLEVVQGGNRLTARDFGFPAALLGGGDSGALLAGLAGSFSLRTTDLRALAALAETPADALSRLPAKHLLTVAGTMRDGAILLTQGTFAAAGSLVELRGGRIALPPAGGDWRRDTTLSASLAVTVPDLAPVASIFGLPALSGSLVAHGKIAGSAGAPTAALNASGKGIVIATHAVGDVVVAGALRENQLRLESLEISRGGDRLRGHATYDLANGTVLAADAELAVADVGPYLGEFGGDAGAAAGSLRATLRATGALPGAPLALEAVFDGGRLRDVTGIQGRATARVTLAGALNEPGIGAATIAMQISGKPGGHELKATLDADYAPGLLRVGAFSLSGAGGVAVQGAGTVPLDLAAAAVLSPGPLSIKAQGVVPALEQLAFLLPPAYALSGSLRANLDVGGSWQEPRIRMDVGAARLQPPAGTRFAPLGPATFDAALTWDNAAVRIETLRIESPALSGALSGAWTSPPSPATLLSTPAGALPGALALTASFRLPDVAWLQGSVPGLRRLSGSVTGELSVQGPAADPAVTGEIQVAGGSFRYEDLPAIDALTATVTLAGRTANLRELRGDVGGSPFTLGGSVDFSRFDDPVLDLRLTGANVLLYRSEGLRVRGDADLTLRGTIGALAVGGEIALTDSLYQRVFSVTNLLSGGEKSSKRATQGLSGISFPEPPLRDMRFDVRLTSRKPFQVRTNALRADARPDLRLTGTGLLPILRGPVYFDAIRLSLPSGTMEFERGSVLFRDADLGRAVLDFGGRMQSGGYVIIAQIGGNLEKPEVMLSSTPPVPREELLLFVVTGAPPASTAGDGTSLGAMATPMAVYLGRGVLEELFDRGSKPRADGLQERIELQIGRETTRSGSVTMDARLLLKKNVIARGDSLYLTAEKDEYDQENIGMKILFKFK